MIHVAEKNALGFLVAMPRLSSYSRKSYAHVRGELCPSRFPSHLNRSELTVGVSVENILPGTSTNETSSSERREFPATISEDSQFNFLSFRCF